MDDEFVRLAQERLKTLLEQRKALQSKMIALDTQISSLSTFVTASTDDVSSIKPILAQQRPTSQAAASEPKSRRRTGPRGRKLKSILAVLRDAYPQGLGFDGITERAAARGVDLVRPSLRSQLSKAKGDGYVENRSGTYFYVPGPLEPDKSQELFSKAESSSEIPAQTSVAEDGEPGGG